MLLTARQVDGLLRGAGFKNATRRYILTVPPFNGLLMGLIARWRVFSARWPILCDRKMMRAARQPHSRIRTHMTMTMRGAVAGLHKIRTTIADARSKLPSARLALPPDHLLALAIALAASFFFFLPTLASLRSDSSGWPSFMLTATSDGVVSAVRPELSPLLEGRHLRMDFLTHGGASSFGFRANMLPIYPPYLLSFLVFDISKIRTAGMVLRRAARPAYFCRRVFLRAARPPLSDAQRGGCVLFAFLYAISFQTGGLCRFHALAVPDRARACRRLCAVHPDLRQDVGCAGCLPRPSS